MLVAAQRTEVQGLLRQTALVNQNLPSFSASLFICMYKVTTGMWQRGEGGVELPIYILFHIMSWEILSMSVAVDLMIEVHSDHSFINLSTYIAIFLFIVSHLLIHVCMHLASS